MIQTIVENTMKYAFDIYRETKIQISVQRKIRDGKKGIEICGQDNGRGYPEAFIRRFESAVSWQGSPDRTVECQNASYLYVWQPG